MVTRWKKRPRRAKKKPKLSDSTSPNGISRRHDQLRSAFSPALCSVVPSASARRRPALPGLERLGLRVVRRPAVQEQHLEGGGDAAGRQGEALGVDLGGAQQGGAPRQARGGARRPGCFRPWRPGRASAPARRRTRRSMVSLSATGRAKPARCSRPAASRRSANGETRGLRPPSISLSAAASAWRSCHKRGAAQHGAEEQAVGLQDAARSGSGRRAGR